MNEKKPAKGIKLLKIFFQYSKLSTKVNLQYKLDSTLSMFAIFFREITNVVIMYLILSRFVKVRGWDMNEMFFLYSFLFLSYSLFVLLFSGIRDFDAIVYSGDFDRVLIRPLGLMFQVIAGKIDYPATIGHGLVGTILLVKTINSVGIHWDTQKIIYYILALIGGAAIQASIFTFTSCFCFFAVKVVNIRNMIFFNTRRIAGYPITFYNFIIQKLLIFIVPFAFVNYFPAQYFLRKSDLINFGSGYLYLTPVVGAVMFLGVCAFWKFGIRHYSSTGTSAN